MPCATRRSCALKEDALKQGARVHALVRRRYKMFMRSLEVHCRCSPGGEDAGVRSVNLVKGHGEDVAAAPSHVFRHSQRAAHPALPVGSDNKAESS